MDVRSDSGGQESGDKALMTSACRRYARYGYEIGVNSAGRIVFKEHHRRNRNPGVNFYTGRTYGTLILVGPFPRVETLGYNIGHPLRGFYSV